MTTNTKENANTNTATAKTETAEVKTERKNAKKDIAQLTEMIPEEIRSNKSVEILENSKGTALHVKLGKERLFGLSAVIVVNRTDFLDGIESDKRNYGYRVAPTSENMMLIYKNALRVADAKQKAAEEKQKAAEAKKAEAAAKKEAAKAAKESAEKQKAEGDAKQKSAKAKGKSANAKADSAKANK